MGIERNVGNIAQVLHDGLTLAQDMGLSKDVEVDVVTRPSVLEPSLRSSDVLHATSEIVALILQEPEIDELPIRSR